MRGRKRSVSGKNPTSPPDTATTRPPAAKQAFSGGGDTSGSPGSSQRLRGPEAVGKTVKHGQPTNGGSIVEEPGTSRGRKEKEELFSRVNKPRAVTESGTTPMVGSKAGEKQVCERTYKPKTGSSAHCSLGDRRPPLAEGATIHAREAAEAVIPPKLKTVNKKGGGRNPVGNVTVLLRRQKMTMTLDGDRVNMRQAKDYPGELVAEVSPPRDRELEAGRGVGQEAATGVKAGPPPCPRTSSGDRTLFSGTSDENRKARKRKKGQEDPVGM